jgi:hypothetical protein
MRRFSTTERRPTASPASAAGPPPGRRALLWLLLAGLVAVQQDLFGWGDAPVIVLGFVPRALAIQVGVSLGAAAVWWWATRWCWPADLEPSDP